jgi:hypothetical protein
LFGDTNTTTVLVTPTLITLDPGQFRGALSCTDAGPLHRYVATLYDESVSPRFALPSSGPVPCSAPVSFAYVVPGHVYSAEIQAYDDADLVPLGGDGSGSPRMLKRSSGEPVTPRWTTSCGEVAADAGAPSVDAATDGGPVGTPRGPTLSVAYVNVTIDTCLPLASTATEAPATTDIAVDPSSALGTLRCGSAPDNVARFEVVPASDALPVSHVTCGQPAVYPGVTSGASYDFDVEAFAPDAGAPTWGTHCTAVTEEGHRANASCDPLASTGSIRVRADTFVGAMGHQCALADVATYQVKSDALQISTPPAACTATTIIGPLAPGRYDLEVTTAPASVTGQCSATVVPGRTVDATCTGGEADASAD